MRQGVTAAVVNREAAMTGDFTRNPDLAFPARAAAAGDRDGRGAARVELRRRRPARHARSSATRIARQPVPGRLRLAARTDPALRRGDRAGDRGQRRRRSNFNRRAFLWGRRAAHDLGRGRGRGSRRPRTSAGGTQTLDELVEHRAAFLDRLPGRGLRASATASLRRSGCARRRQQACRAAPTWPRPSRATCSS